MSQVAPFHSKDERPERYHNNSRCGPGSEIPSHKRVPGTGNKPLCKDCAKLNSEGK